MRGIGYIIVALAATLAITATALAKPQSFRAWSTSWTALTTRDNDRVVSHCQKLFGASDLKFGMCYVKAGHANLTAERRLWERQMKTVAVGQNAPCKRAIVTYMSVARLRQSASLMYLESHGRTPLSRIASDIGAEPYSTLKTMNDKAKARAVAICG
jgi:hypothetical protein